MVLLPYTVSVGGLICVPCCDHKYKVKVTLSAGCVQNCLHLAMLIKRNTINPSIKSVVLEYSAKPHVGHQLSTHHLWMNLQEPLTMDDRLFIWLKVNIYQYEIINLLMKCYSTGQVGWDFHQPCQEEVEVQVTSQVTGAEGQTKISQTVCYPGNRKANY